MTVGDLERTAQFVVDAEGHKKAVMLDLALWEELTARLTQLERGAMPPSTTSSTAWEDLRRLGEEIGRGWQAPMSSVELLSEMRR